MAIRRPLVLRNDGREEELPSNDMLAREAVNWAGNYVLSALSGVSVAETTDLSVTLTAASSAVFQVRRDQLNYSSNRAITTGGALTAHQGVVNIASGSGAVDKVVVDFAQVNVSTSAVVNTILLFEASIAQISSAATINGAVGFYFPNLRAVPNIARISTLGAFINDDPKALCRTAGPFYNRSLQEFAPAYHVGLAAGRYYTAPYRTIGDAVTTANFAALIPIFIPHTVTINELGFQVSAGVAGNALFAIYTAERGKVQNRVWQSTSTLATNSVGVKTQNPNVELAPGTYWIALATSAAVQIKYHQPQSSDQRSWMVGQPASSTNDAGLHRATYIALGGFAVGIFPATVDALPQYIAQDGEPHVWFRVAA